MTGSSRAERTPPARRPPFYMEDRTRIEGTLERIVFQNPENSWTVARIRDEAEDRLLTIVGRLPGVSVGESLRLAGKWVFNPRFGEQFEIESYEVKPPVTTIGIERYLASGLVKGIGPEMAKRIVERFGVESLDVIDAEADRLLEVDGIGAKRLAMIREGWGEQKNVRETLVFLHQLPIGPALAARIYEAYGEETVRRVRTDPYALADEVWGVGFQTADRVASALGIAKDSPRRAEAGVLYTLGQLSQAGHVCYPRAELARAAGGFLEQDEAAADEAIGRLLANGSVVAEELEEGHDLIYRAEMLEAEEMVARSLRGLLVSAPAGPSIDSHRALRWLEDSFDFPLGDEQKVAVEAGVDGRVVVVTGGPGTGKTTLVRSLLAILARAGEEVVLAAPTGRAAKKLEEATG
ncbi:MAG: ATP-dependent RecD-like DNA helicase, partial [Candidatus Latescibacterota bacterium]